MRWWSSSKRTRTVPSKLFPKPADWGKDPLSEFLDAAQSNTFATFVNKRGWFSKFVVLDQAFIKVITTISHEEDILFGLLLLRSHASFRSACQLAMGGQCPECFMVLRGCLEAALYALHITEHPELGEIWLNRHTSADAEGRCRGEFAYGQAKRTLEAKSKKYFDILTALYERTIAFGAHPNERSVTGSLKKTQEGNRTEFSLAYLEGDTLQLNHILKTTAQIGACSLHIAQVAYPQRFAILGLDKLLDSVTHDI